MSQPIRGQKAATPKRRTPTRKFNFVKPRLKFPFSRPPDPGRPPLQKPPTHLRSPNPHSSNYRTLETLLPIPLVSRSLPLPFSTPPRKPPAGDEHGRGREARAPYKACRGAGGGAYGPFQGAHLQENARLLLLLCRRIFVGEA